MAAPFSLADALEHYRRRWPDEYAGIDAFVSFLRRHGEDAFHRHCEPGHFTGSAWLVSGDGERVLLTHHRKLERWLQPGGHCDGDPDLPRVALREAQEETGLDGLQIDPAIFDIDRHRIPARSGEPGHWHYDVRFVVRATVTEAFTVSQESHDLAWRRLDQVELDEHADPSVRRMAAKWLTQST
ncbi:MAG TPA: NUDIX hydrolase [Xanthomonadaceae bacterium]|nr:NUDIX hydrolase [Xanthomonadaceae bacterium]